MPYGSLDTFQVHYIVETGESGVDTEQFLARCEPITKGHFGDRRVVAVKWTGASAFADRLQNDSRLTELLKEVLLTEREIRIDPLDDHVRIYGMWNHYETMQANTKMVEVADIIAGHIKAAMS
ncbi:hypothetical protein [Nitrososphaera sp.]|uniref:hypothetical protein n=1 Tax=Nitrososphaera sp. TaxID=1971748 RepID=UPI00307D836B